MVSGAKALVLLVSGPKDPVLCCCANGEWSKGSCNVLLSEGSCTVLLSEWNKGYCTVLSEQ